MIKRYNINIKEIFAHTPYTKDLPDQIFKLLPKTFTNEQKKTIQGILMTLLYYAREMDSTLLLPISKLATDHHNPTPITQHRLQHAI